MLLFHSHGCCVSFACGVQKTPRILTRKYFFKEKKFTSVMEAYLCRMARYESKPTHVLLLQNLLFSRKQTIVKFCQVTVWFWLVNRYNSLAASTKI